MKDWGVGVGKDSTSLCCSEGPWWTYFIDWLVEARCCTTLFKWKGVKYSLHDIDLPKWPTWNSEYGQMNPYDYIGDVGSVIHSYVIWPIQEWCWKHRKSDWMVDVPWEQLKPHQPADTVKWVEETYAEWAKYDAEKEAEERALTAATQSNSDAGSDSKQSEVSPESGGDNQGL
jgi:hypothetical protein